ncbi:Integrase zinc binding domain [Popillia japonica]|uniref:RNA-directed DNA polymerase n=1 Tax=Popillia japonica TaxID=7064 RepID=A0AAW1N2N7_POPJA
MSSGKSTSWTVPILILEFKKTLTFLVDTGADVNCIPLKLIPPRFVNQIRNTNKVINGPDGNPLEGKPCVVADSLSRNPLSSNEDRDELEDEVQAYVNFVIANLPVKDTYLKKIITPQRTDSTCRKLREYTPQEWPDRRELSNEMLQYYQYRYEISISDDILLTPQRTDSTCRKLREYTPQEWPDRRELSNEMLQYYQYRYEISISDDILLKNNRIVIPPSLQKEVLDLIHSGHQGIVKCRRRAFTSVWWLGLSTHLANLIKSCPNCIEERSPEVPRVQDNINETETLSHEQSKQIVTANANSSFASDKVPRPSRERQPPGWLKDYVV